MQGGSEIFPEHANQNMKRSVLCSGCDDIRTFVRETQGLMFLSDGGSTKNSGASLYTYKSKYEKVGVLPIRIV